MNILAKKIKDGRRFTEIELFKAIETTTLGREEIYRLIIFNGYCYSREEKMFKKIY